MDDLRALLEYLTSKSPQAAQRMHDSILETCAVLGDNPYLAVKLDDLEVANIRRFPVIHYAHYSIFYRVTDAGVEIVRLGFGGREWTHII
ncbi:MAG TPA: type II toxin-antitoxin system RelE/ParE family toxin [Gammaproteobacteria bacterium]|nr:type II toxin-antitoxin system RelE/ParE family toxin [Gammaproteobacteria bacterium]